MILYHGSNIEIEKIDLSKCRPYKDLGKGLYTTELLEQAEKMAKRVARIYANGQNRCLTPFSKNNGQKPETST